MSTTLIVSEAVELFPHASVAVHVRVTEYVPEHPPEVVTSAKVRITDPHPSDVTGVVNDGEDGHEIVDVAGREEIVGDVMSTVRINCCVTLMLLPHASITLYVRITVSLQPDIDGTPSFTKVTVGIPHPSASSVTTATSGAGYVPLQPGNSIEVGLDAVGGETSTVLIKFCETIILLLAASVTW